MAELRKNNAKHKLKNGEPVIAVSSTDTDMIDFLGSTGVVDIIWMEMEHGEATWSQLGGKMTSKRDQHGSKIHP